MMFLFAIHCVVSTVTPPENGPLRKLRSRFGLFESIDVKIPSGGDCSSQASVTQCKENHECRRPNFGTKCIERDYDDTCTCQIIFCQDAEITLHKLDDNGKRKICNIVGPSTDKFLEGNLCWPWCYRKTEIDKSSNWGFFMSLGKVIEDIEPIVCQNDIYAVNDRKCEDDDESFSKTLQTVYEMAPGRKIFVDFIKLRR